MAEQPQSRPCTGCQGQGGWTEDTSADGVTRQNWHRCGGCSGTGTAT